MPFYPLSLYGGKPEWSEAASVAEPHCGAPWRLRGGRGLVGRGLTAKHATMLPTATLATTPKRGSPPENRGSTPKGGGGRKKVRQCFKSPPSPLRGTPPVLGGRVARDYQNHESKTITDFHSPISASRPQKLLTTGKTFVKDVNLPGFKKRRPRAGVATDKPDGR